MTDHVRRLCHCSWFDNQIILTNPFHFSFNYEKKRTKFLKLWSQFRADWVYLLRIQIGKKSGTKLQSRKLVATGSYKNVMAKGETKRRRRKKLMNSNFCFQTLFHWKLSLTSNWVRTHETSECKSRQNFLYDSLVKTPRVDASV